MAALIPAIGTCVSNMTGGERRLAYRLEQKLEDDWLRCFYNDAQSIYGRDKRGKISFKSLGILTQGRTTILKINYRNTQEVLELASGIASDLLKPSASDEDGIPLVAPISPAATAPSRWSSSYRVFRKKPTTSPNTSRKPTRPAPRGATWP